MKLKIWITAPHLREEAAARRKNRRVRKVRKRRRKEVVVGSRVVRIFEWWRE